MGEVIEIRSFKTGKKYRYLINNIQSVAISLVTPATAMPLPLAGDANNILTKAEGNTCRITVAWTLHDETADVVLANNYDTDANTVGGGTTPFGLGGGSGNQVRTADDQLKFLVNNQAETSPAFSGFQSTYIEDKYQLIMGNIGFSRVGLIESLEVSKSGTTPITWNANMSFIAGAPIAAE
tara:strand:+ start:2165 stop:2707 length:543 start_codon:yes stop_codon:yes gene_type:complete